MFIALKSQLLVASALLLGAQSVMSAPVTYGFTAVLDAGPLLGTNFAGSFAFDSTAETGIGQEYFSLTSFDFILLGSTFTRSDISQGGQVILDNGRVSFFTAAIFPQSPTSPVSDIAFGFGGPGIIGYTVPPGFSTFGSGRYVISTSPVPEPSMVLLLAAGLAAAAAWRRRACDPSLAA